MIAANATAKPPLVDAPVTGRIAGATVVAGAAATDVVVSTAHATLS
jgi:hypothetical protein